MENQIDRARLLTGRQTRARVQGVAARARSFRRTRPRHHPDPRQIPGEERDRADAGWLCAVEPAAGIRSRAGGGRQARLHRRRCRRRAGKAAKAAHALQNIRSVGGLSAPPQRHHLRGLPPDPRHWRFSLSGCRLDGGKTVQFDCRAGFAAFLRRSGPPPRHPRRVARRPDAGLFARALPAGRSCAAAPSSPAPSIMTAGARIAMCSAREANDNDNSFRDWTCAEGLACQAAAPPRAWACAL